MSKANGELVAFLDTDDIWLPDKLNLQIKYFEKSSVGMVISNTLLFSEFRNKALFNKNPPTGNVYKNLILRFTNKSDIHG